MSKGKIFVAGHKGMVGSSIAKRLVEDKKEIITVDRRELDLTNQDELCSFLKHSRVKEIYLCAARVGGIQANNTFPADFIYDNLMIQCSVIHSAHLVEIEKLLFLGSSCIYPKNIAQPMDESSLLTGILEETNEAYSIAKIAGIKLCESYNRQYGHDFRSIMPTNLYGPNDNFHKEHSHVVPSLIRKFHDAVQNNENEVIVWGSGKPRREFLHVDELASASVYLMDIKKSEYNSVTKPMMSHINVGSGQEYSIKELAEIIANVTGFKGKISFDISKPDGIQRKLLDSSKINKLGWRSKVQLKSGIKTTYEWFISNQDNFRK